MQNINILFVICHPDDEALWVGGLIHGLSKFSHVGVHVLCLSGQDEASARPMEFEAARTIAGYKAGVVLGGALRPANQKLPPVAKTVSDGLQKLALSVGDIAVLITHSPFGEEHMHPHHVQASTELYSWAVTHRVPFGYFSCVPMINSCLQPMLRSMKRHESLQVLNYARCKYGYLRRVTRWCIGKPWLYPTLYIQWLVDASAKRAMLECYRSIDLELHEQAYAMFNNNVESIYLFDGRGLRVFEQLLELMEVPGSPDYFPSRWTISSIIERIANKFRLGKV